MTKLERIEAKIADARKKLDRAITQRDQAIKTLTKSAAAIVGAGRALGRLEKQKADLRKQERAASKGASVRRAEDGEVGNL